MIRIKTASEIESMRVSARLVSRTLDELTGHVAPGVTTLELDRLAMEFIRKNGGTPSFLGYRGYRHTICASVNEEVVHGIPGKRTLKEGDIISVDVGVLMNGFHGDSARTFKVGRVSQEAENLLAVTRESLVKGIEQVRAGNRLGDVSSSIQAHVEAQGLSIVRSLVGHGIGRDLHEDPQIPNFGQPGSGVVLKSGMVFAIEPMVNIGGYEVETLKDGWTVVSSDRSLAAHFEHTVAVTDNGPDILSLS
ncbi:MAG: type I methionyl aminopeptidase [Candidatus Eisenbacteria bacterium]|nr:type I methionyl aminopeptidase [Candidatus Eisenbacteria bacterium]